METYLTPEELAEIRRLGANFTPPRDLAIMLGYDPDWMATSCRLRHTNPEVFDAYHSGFLETEMQINNCGIRLALQGSVPALRDTLNLIANSKAKLFER